MDDDSTLAVVFYLEEVLVVNELILTCILAVTTPQGQICVKPDGTVQIPENITIDQASRDFWKELSIKAPYLCDYVEKKK